MEILFKRPDGSFVATVNGLPYHVVEGDPLHEGVDLTNVPLETLPAEPTAEELLAQERAAMVCSRFQARAALLAAGLLDSVEAVMANADPLPKLAWQEAIEFRRTSPTIAGLQAAVGLTDTQIDDLFRAAMVIEA